jgi:hypothetical protein
MTEPDTITSDEACEHGDHPDVGDGACPCGTVVYHVPAEEV